MLRLGPFQGLQLGSAVQLSGLVSLGAILLRARETQLTFTTLDVSTL